MSIVDIVIGIIITGWLGSVEYRIRGLDVRLRNAPTRDEVVRDLEMYRRVAEANHGELKKDIREIRAKIDLLLMKLSKD